MNNVVYLTKKNSIRSKDIRYILNKVGADLRKRYDYDLLERTYMECMAINIDDSVAMRYLSDILTEREVLLLAPGRSVEAHKEAIGDFVNARKPVVVSINFIHDSIPSDYVYVSNVKRYTWLKNQKDFMLHKKIIASNIKRCPEDTTEYIISFSKLVKCGWEHMDNSVIMFLRLLDMFRVASIAIAGFDGYSFGNSGTPNYANYELELSNVREDPGRLNDEISNMLDDYMATRRHRARIEFLTESRFSSNLLEG